MFLRTIVVCLIVALALGVLVVVTLLIGKSPSNHHQDSSLVVSLQQPRSGAHDLVNDLDECASALAVAVARHGPFQQDHQSTVFLAPATLEGEGMASELQLCSAISQELSFRNRSSVVLPNSSSGARLITLYLEIEMDHYQGPRVTLSGSGFERAVILDSVERPVLSPKVLPTQIAFRILTGIGQSSEFEASTEAKHQMATRLRLEAYMLAERREWIDPVDRADFLRLMEAEYSEAILVGMGSSEVVTRSRDIDGLSSPSFEGAISWRGDRHSFERIAEAISDRIRLRNRAPTIRALIAVALLVLCIVGWLKVDWWLKGNYGVVTAVGFVVLFSLVMALVWSIRYDAIV